MMFLFRYLLQCFLVLQPFASNTFRRRIVSKLTNKLTLIALSVLAASAFAFAAPSTAQAGQFEIGGGFGYESEQYKNDDGNGMNGINFRLIAGYKFLDWVGIYLNQDLGGTFRSDNDITSSRFVGSTIVSGDFFYPAGAFKFMGTVGIGATYHGKSHIEYDGYYETMGSSEGAFAFRVGIGGYYMLSQQLGLGLTFDYTLGAYDGWNDHILNVLLGVRYAF